LRTAPIVRRRGGESNARRAVLCDAHHAWHSL